MTDHSTPTSEPDVTPPDGSLRVFGIAHRAFRIAAWLFAAVAMLLVASFLLFRFVLLPNLDRLRPYAEQTLSSSSGMAIKVGRIDGEWLWWAPVLTLYDVQLRAVPDAPTIRLSRVELVPAWKSWLHLEPRLSSLRLNDLQLSLVRDAQGQVRLNGIELTRGGGSNHQALDWLLRQDSIELTLQQLSWHDQLLALPPLQLNGLSLRLSDGWRGHQLTLHGQPNSALLPGLSLDGSWQGEGVDNWRQWQGKLEVAAGSGELSLLKRYWPQAPFAGKGRASSKINAEFAEGRITSLQGRWQVEDVTLALQRRDLPLPKLAGELDYRSAAAGEHTLVARHLTLASEFGHLLRDASLDARWHDTRGGQVQVSGLSLNGLWPVLLQRIPALHDTPLVAVNGELGKTVWQWHGAWRKPQDYRLTTAFSGLRPQLAANVSVQGEVAGELDVGRNKGSLSLHGQGVTLEWPAELKTPLLLQKLAGQFDWQRQAAGWQLNMPAVQLTTPDFTAALDGKWQLPDSGASHGELMIQVPRVAINRVSRYLPAVIGRDTLHWLDGALNGGEASKVRARVQGDFRHFPFAGGKGGRFDVDADIQGGQLQFDPAWPAIRAIQGRFAMRNDLIQIDADSASSADVALRAVKVRLPDLMTQPAHLLIDGVASGALPVMLAYTQKSPVDGWLGGFLSTIDSKGAASLTLGLDIPLDTPERSKVSGDIALQNNWLQLRSLPLPALESVSGLLHFNEHGVSSPGIGFGAFGGQGQLQATLAADDSMQFSVQGEAQITPVLQQYVPLLSPLAAGKTPYHGTFSVRHNLDDLQLQLSLQGTGIHAPAPLDKAAEAEWPLQLRLRPTLQGWMLNWQQAERAQGTVALDAHGELRALTVGVGTVAPQNEHGILIAVQQPQLDLLPWLGVVLQRVAEVPAGGNKPIPLQLHLVTPLLQLGTYRLHDVDSRLEWLGGEAPLALQWQSAEAEGQLHYAWQGAGVAQARLSRLHLPLPEVDDDAATLKLGASGSVPALDVAVDQLFWEQHQLGQLNVKAQANGAQWQLEQVELAMPEGRVRINGVLARARDAQQQTAVDAVFDISDAGGVLTRFGMPEAVLGGKGKLTGHLLWPGSLRDFDVAQLGGNIALELRNGRFSQVNPGMARLLGVLSLQSLSRRMRLDFTDVFSSGFAFDEITGQARVKQGVFSTDNLSMTGPSARVALHGEADLVHNQQNIRARITPNLSESVSLLAGATMLNPLVGAATLLTQKVLQDPINQVFSFEYQISGSLTDPQVSKVGEIAEPKPPATTP